MGLSRSIFRSTSARIRGMTVVPDRGRWLLSQIPYREERTDMRIALVHGAWADGSSWAAVIRRLQAAGHDVIAPQFPHTSLADNVAKLRHVLTLQAEPTVVAGHSYGCQVITALGSDAPNVVGLVYVAGFGLDEGESLGALLGQGPPTPAIAALRSTIRASPGCPRTPSFSTSLLTSTRSRPA